MEIELHPAVSLLPETNSHQEMQRYKILFISGNYSRILSRLDRNITERMYAGPSPPSSL